MIALTILATWLALTGAGFAGLTALRRAGAREDARARAAFPSELQGSVLADMGAPIPRALAR